MKITLNPDKVYQKYEGIGASGAWWAQIVGGWTNTDANGEEVRNVISRLLYSKENGIGINIYRYNIGGGSAQSGNGEYSDFARRAESFDTDDGKYDFSRDANAVYMMKQAVRDGADEIILFVNSPIERLTKNGWAHLKKNQAFRTNLSRKNYNAFADYCLDVTEHFVKEGLPVKYLSPINEPFWIWTGGQEGCHYSPRQAGQVMCCFARKLRKRKTLDSVKLSGVENGDIRWFNKSYTRHLLKYKEVVDCIDSIDLHSYCLHMQIPFFNDRVKFLKRYRKWLDRKYPDMPVKMSEWTHMVGGKNCGMDSALETAKVMYEDMTILNVTSWQHWLACSHYDYHDGLIYLDLEKKSYEMTKRYYVTGNFSKYIPLGAVRFFAVCDDKDVKIVAFKNEEKTIVIVINPTTAEKSYRVPCDALLAVTDKDNDLKETNVKTDSEIIILPESVTTIVMNEGSYD